MADGIALYLGLSDEALLWLAGLVFYGLEGALLEAVR